MRVEYAVRRLLSTFPANEREARAYDLITSVRFIMVQHLLPRIDQPGVIPVREYLRFTDRVREKLLARPMVEWPSILNTEVADPPADADGEDMRMCLKDTCRHYFRQGVISRHDAIQIGGIHAVEI